MYRKVLILGFVALSLLGSPLDDAINNGIDWLCSNQNPDSTWGKEPLKFLSTSLVLRSFISVEREDSIFDMGLEKFSQEELPSVDHIARFIEVVLPIKGDTTGILDTLLSFQNPDKGFGVYHRYESDPLDVSLVLRALWSISYTDYQRIEEILSFLLNARKDSFWVDVNNNPSLYLTTLSLISLSHYQSIFDLSEPINKGIEWVLQHQNGDGGFLRTLLLPKQLKYYSIRMGMGDLGLIQVRYMKQHWQYLQL